MVTDVNDYRLDIAKKWGRALPSTSKPSRRGRDEICISLRLRTSAADERNENALNNAQAHAKRRQRGAAWHAGPGTVIDWNDVIFKGLTLQGIYGRRMYETWYKMMAMVEVGLDLSPVLTHRYHYTDFEEAFAVMNSGQSGKVVLDWTQKEKS